MSAAEQIPEPRLEYHSPWSRAAAWDPDVIAEGTVRLYSVHEVHVSRDPDGTLYAYLRGPMRKRDGQRGRHSRGIRAEPHPDQPHWLTMLFADAALRLPSKTPGALA